MHRAAAAVLLAVLASGCATSGSGSGSSGSGSPPSSAPSTTAPTSAAPTSGPAPTGTVTVQGVVERGVEPGCLVLHGGGKSYTLLQGADATPATGIPVAVPVEVVGIVLHDVASYCQQGTLLRVVGVRRG
jgi:hypothetical protein